MRKNHEKVCGFGSRPLQNWLSSVLLCTLVTGCHIGPAYHPPAIQPPPAFKETPPAGPTANPPQGTNGNGTQENGTWTVAQPADAKIRGDWWDIFNDPELNDLESPAEHQQPKHRSSISRILWKSRALVREARAQYFPTVSVLGRLTTVSVPPEISATNATVANPGKESQIYASAIGCFLDARSLWQNPQGSPQCAVHRAGQRRGSGERAAGRAGRFGRILF